MSVRALAPLALAALLLVCLGFVGCSEKSNRIITPEANPDIDLFALGFSEYEVDSDLTGWDESENSGYQGSEDDLELYEEEGQTNAGGGGPKPLDDTRN